MKDEFARFHPMVNFIFYAVVLGITMFQMQIGLVLISVCSALVYYFCLKGMEGMPYLFVIGCIFLLSSLINPLFSHKGATFLFYLFTGNPVTLESIVYGIVSAAIISGMLLWFSTFHQIMGMERMLGAVGKAFPHIALLITMILRFIPKYTKHQREVAVINKTDGSSWKDRIRQGSKTFSITATWALENSVYTADSMKARGFGAAKRTGYSNYKIEGRDVLAILWIVALAAGVLWMLRRECLFTYYYPYIVYKESIPAYVLYTLLCMTPVGIHVGEEIRWHRLKSKI